MTFAFKEKTGDRTFNKLPTLPNKTIYRHRNHSFPQLDRILQRSVGNGYLQEINRINRQSAGAQIQRACTCGSCPRCPQGQNAPNLQAKIKIGTPDDKYEQEADLVAEQVMQMPAPQVQQQIKPEGEEEEKTVLTKPIVDQTMPLVQKQIEPEEEEEMVQTKTQSHHPNGIRTAQRLSQKNTGEFQAESAIAASTPSEKLSIEHQLSQSSGGGKPMGNDVRSFMEPRFGTDFGNVRIHTGSSAVQMNQTLGSLAFTSGRDIYFNSGKYNPDTQSGKSLLAHELTHVIQQRGSNSIPSTQRKASTSNNLVHPKKSRSNRWKPLTSTIQRNPNETVQRKVKVDPGLSLNMHGYTHTKSGDVYTAPRIAKSSVFHEIFTSLLHSPRTFKIKGSTNEEIDKNFRKHRSARHGVVKFAEKKQYTFGAGSAFRMNPTYWNVTATSWSLKPGVDRTEAINDLNKNPSKYNIACLAATKLTMEGGGKSPTKNQGSADLSDWVPGDWGYITNNSFTGLSADIGLEGENIIYMGKDKFWGHFGSGNTLKTLADWKASVESWNGSATIENQRSFPSAGLD